MRLLVWVAVLPAAAASVLVASFAALELAGRTPFAYRRPSNIAEAAGMGMAAEVLGRMRLGQDPRAVRDVRADIISSSIPRVTALEAAVWSRRLRLVRLLDREGAIGSGPERDHLACLARLLRAGEIETYLAPGAAAGCDPEKTIRAIEARAR
jgi:hypothetical protein